MNSNAIDILPHSKVRLLMSQMNDIMSLERLLCRVLTGVASPVSIYQEIYPLTSRQCQTITLYLEIQGSGQMG
eukprot:gnl/Chilomastix_caulleri/5870.p2 GENE.gnl/Chilomastix_caulleri/5870~~gnl/Chilomastix_caulleri/5870.p2  ORF type:complete len:73 (+),score=1.42 gnl/Chilomastix_caulleri/5870:199-417(+)